MQVNRGQGNIERSVSVLVFWDTWSWSFTRTNFSLQISALMDKFEQQFEHLDVQSNYMETAMSDTTTLTVPQVI